MVGHLHDCAIVNVFALPLTVDVCTTITRGFSRVAVAVHQSRMGYFGFKVCATLTITDICGHGEGFLYLSGSSAISDLHNC